MYDTDFFHNEILFNKYLNQFASSLTKTKTINSISIVQLAIIVYFLDFQNIELSPRVKT